MKKVVINVPDDYEVQVVRKEVKFKKGDIVISRGGMMALKSTTSCSFLAFHTEKQRDNFLKYNYELVKDYLML